MVNNSKNERYTIGVNWGVICIASVALVFVYYILRTGTSMHRPQDNVSILHFMLVCGILLFSCRSYFLDSKGFGVRLFNIPIKQITWNYIGAVILVRKRLNGPAGNSEGVILVIPINCEPFRIGEDKVDLYAARHPFSVYSISAPPKKLDEYAKAFQKYYGDIVELETHK